MRYCCMLIFLHVNNVFFCIIIMNINQIFILDITVWKDPRQY